MESRLEEQLFKLKCQVSDLREAISHYTSVKQRIEQERQLVTAKGAKVMMSAIDSVSLTEIHAPYYLEDDDALEVITKVHELCNKRLADLKDKAAKVQKSINELEKKREKQVEEYGI